MNLPPELRSGKAIARPYTSDDLIAFMGFMTDPEVNYYMDNITLCKEEAEELFEKIHHIYQNPPPKVFYVWAVEFNSACIGHLELKETKHTNGNELEVVYLLHKDFWRKGIMSGLITGVNEFAKSIGKKVIATVDKGNFASIELLQKIGIAEQKVMLSDDRVLKIVLK